MFISKNTIKKIGHHACLRVVMGQTYPNYAGTSANYMYIHHFMASLSILWKLEARDFKVTLETNLIGINS